MEVVSFEKDLFVKTLKISQEIAEKINYTLNFEDLLTVVLDLALEHSSGQKGLLYLLDETSEEFNIRASKNIDGDKELEDLNKAFFKYVIDYLREYPTIILNSDNPEKNKSMLATRLTISGRHIGYICIFNRNAIFEEKAKHLLEIIAVHAAIALKSNQLHEQVEYEAGIRNNLQRYLPKSVISQIMENNIDMKMIGQEQECSILFSDICGFTSLSEKMKPETVVAFLNEYLTIMSKIIFSYNGSIDKYIGDGILAVFGAPISTPNHAVEATLAALEMKNRIPKLRERFQKEFGIENFNIRIGINTGPVVYGNVGSPQRLDFTVIGDNVNTAARMESNAPKGSIMVSYSTYKQIKNFVEVKNLGTISVKGKRDAIRVFEVIGKATNKQSPLNLKVSVSDETKRMFQSKRVPVKSFVMINKDGNITNGLMRDIGIKGASIGVRGNYREGQELTISFKLTEEISFKNIRVLINRVEKSNQELISNKAHILIEVSYLDIEKTDLIELAKFVKKR